MEDKPLGDCFRQSLAFVLRRPKGEVPHYADDPGCDWDGMLAKNREWLASQGLDLLAFWFHGSWKLEALLKWFQDYNPGRRAILAGSAGGESHAVGIWGDKIALNICPIYPLEPLIANDEPYWFFYVVAAK